MTVLVDFEAPNRITIRVSGTLRREEVDAGKRQVHDLMQAHGHCLAMIKLEPGFSNLEAFVRWDDIDVDQVIKRHIIRLAVVGDLRWRDSALLFLFNTMVPFQIEYFSAARDEFAKAWLTD